MSPGKTERMTLEQLDAAFQPGVIVEGTLIREPGSNDWRPLYEVAGLDPPAEPPAAPIAEPPAEPTAAPAVAHKAHSPITNGSQSEAPMPFAPAPSLTPAADAPQGPEASKALRTAGSAAVRVPARQTKSVTSRVSAPSGSASSHTTAESESKRA